jgi:hypothetical protein
LVVAVSAQSAPWPPGVLIRAAKLTCGVTRVDSHWRRGAKDSGAALKSLTVVTPAAT